jgi:hypothetical protein
MNSVKEAVKRMDVFINVHKGLRGGLLGFSARVGRLDWADGEEVKATGTELAGLIHFLREHAANEDEVQFPMLEKREPAAVVKAQEEHHHLEKVVDELEAKWAEVTQSPDPSGIGYLFYRAFNRFLSQYLSHMDREEGEVTEAIYRHFTDPEIAEEFKKIIARTSPQDMGMMLGYMFPGMNGPERFLFLSAMKKSAPPEVFGKVKGLAQRVLPPKDWEKLAAQLG